ncbi:MAG: hypothetical protein ACREOW_13370 [Thermodesulfobacteriota bacterium]
MCNRYKKVLLVFIVGALSTLIIGGSNGGGGGGAYPKTNLSIEICDPETGGPFTTDINNDFFPVVPGSESVLESEDETIRLEISVPGDTENVAGVTTRVLVEEEKRL